MRWLTTGTLAPAFRSCPSLSLSKLRLVGWRWIEGGFDRMVDALEPYEPDLVAGFFAHVLEVLAVARGSMTVEIPAWIAASTSSFTPPLGSTRPRSEISPVMAVSLRMALSREPNLARAKSGSPNSGSGCGSSLPRPESFFSEDAERAAGCEMALDVEHVLDDGVNGQEALS